MLERHLVLGTTEKGQQMQNRRYPGAPAPLDSGGVLATETALVREIQQNDARVEAAIDPARASFLRRVFPDAIERARALNHARLADTEFGFRALALEAARQAQLDDLQDALDRAVDRGKAARRASQVELSLQEH